MAGRYFLHRASDSIKGDFGRTLILGGSSAYPNAPLIALCLASSSGVGYVAASFPQEVKEIDLPRMPLTAIYEDCFEKKETSPSRLNRYDSILFGNGVAKSEENKAFLLGLLTNYQGNLVIDATGIDLFGEILQEGYSPEKAKAQILLTPHIGEFNRLVGASSSSRDPSREDAALFAKKWGVYLLLKSNSSALYGPKGEKILSSYPSTPALAKAGSGDGLAGFLSGLLAYGGKSDSFLSVVEFGDEYFHRAARLMERELTQGFSSVIDLPPYLRKLALSLE